MEAWGGGWGAGGERYNPHPLDFEITLLPPSRSKDTTSQETALGKKKKVVTRFRRSQHPPQLPWLSTGGLES